MDVRSINSLLSQGNFDSPLLWPHFREMEAQPLQFPFEFSLQALPEEPGLLTVRGPRQYGKSTWLELQMKNSAQTHGPGSTYYLNGDELLSVEALSLALEEIASAYSPSARVKRLFIDEITAVPDWEKAMKRILDRGILRDVLIVTTGSKAADLRHGAERLPGRKGKLAQTEHLFLPVSYSSFYNRASDRFGDQTWIVYLLSGGSPVALNALYETGALPEYFIQMMRDWIYGEVVSSGRSRLSLHNLFQVIFKLGSSPIGFTKLAKESGLANNTVASGYIEQLSDLLCLIPSWIWDAQRRIFIPRKPCKFHFINLAAAVALHPANLRSIADFEKLDAGVQSHFLEWMVAQELWRRQALLGAEGAERLGFWASKEHEIDFVMGDESFWEVKRGRAGPLDFSWFPKIFPNQKLKVVCATPFEAQQVQGISVHEFLMQANNAA